MKNNLILFKLILVSRLIHHLFSAECNRSYPILKNNECISTYCNEVQFKKKECIINNPISKTTWITNIIIFENTNGEFDFSEEITLAKEFCFHIILNNTERLYFGMIFNEQKYIFFDENDNYYPLINALGRNKMIKPSSLHIVNNYYDFIISIGSKNSDIEILDLNILSNNLLNNVTTNLKIIEPGDFLNSTNIIISGISPYVQTINSFLIYGSIITEIDNPSNNYLALFCYKLFVPKSYINLQYLNYSLELVKGEIISCFIFDLKLGHLSCIYLSEYYNYTVINIYNTDTFQVKNKTEIGFLNDKTNENIFFKGILFDSYKGIYCYFSGDSNEIPTFIFKNIDKKTFELTDIFSEFQIVYLEDYSFNNNFEYNDLVLGNIDDNKFYFISTDIAKNILIIVYFQLYISSSNRNNLIIRYYTIKLQDNYNIKILNGFKALLYNKRGDDNFLTIAIDFCYNDIYQNSHEINNNEALIIFSYPNITSEMNIDFIEYSINNNIDYILIDLSKNFRIENNIFGYYLNGIIIFECTLENGINFYDWKSGRLLDFEDYDSDDYYRNPEENILKIELSDDLIEEKTIYLTVVYWISEPNNLEDFNQYCDSYNNKYGNVTNEEFSQESSIKTSLEYNYYINIIEELSRECNDNNCTLCLYNDKDYCLVCKDENFTIIYNDSFKYNKKKICIKEETIETTINEESSDIFITESIATDGTNNFDNLTNEINISFTDFNSSNDALLISSILNEQNKNNTDIETVIFSTKNEISETLKYNDSEISNHSNIINDEKSEVFKSTESETDRTKETIFLTEYETTRDTELRNSDVSSNNNTLEISLVDLFGGKYKDIELSSEQIEELYNNLKNYILNDYDGKTIIINTGNFQIEISTLDSQKSSELSNVNLGECENVLKEKYCKTDEDDLIMLKFDINLKDEKSTYVQYEIYESNSKIFLELEECSGSDVIINVPIDLESNIELLYNMLANSGYNLFDANDSFYNDICAVYTTENGTDILLYDRRMDIYQKTLNISLCQEGCKFLSYNSKTKKAQCDCPIQSNSMDLDLSDIKFDKNKMVDDFYSTLKNSNFRVLKCYKLVYNQNVFIRNLGSIVMTVLFSLFIILMIIYKVKSSKKINHYIQNIMRQKYLIRENGSYFKLEHNNYKVKEKRDKKELIDSVEENKKEAKNEKRKKIIKKGKKRVKRNSVIITNNLNLILENMTINRNRNKNNSTIIQAPSKRKRKEGTIEKKKKKLRKRNQVNHKDLNTKNSILLSYSSAQRNLNDSNKLNTINKNDGESIYSINIHNNNQIIKKLIPNKNYQYNRKEENKEDNNFKTGSTELNDEEINSLSYKKALELDKRTYFQYYLSLIRKKQLILFTFIPTNDYNILSLKIALFIVSFALYLSINAFFFNDETMHKIYKNNGIYNVIARIPKIFYSSIISSIINLLLKNLSLSEKNILKIKNEKEIDVAVQKSQDMEKCIKIKFIIFFIISLLLMLFFWYFISCFCAVYNNTQIILFKDTLISFALSMIYPFAINLLPGIFRIPALIAKKKDKNCLYSFSKLLALI